VSRAHCKINLQVSTIAFFSIAVLVLGILVQIRAQSGQQTREEPERNELNDGLKTGKHEVLSVEI
jgi:hypothetical protein